MNFLVVDDIKIILEEECALLKKIRPDCRIAAATSVKDALALVKEETFEVAFLDIELGDVNMDGIMLAKELKDIQPHLHIIFVTAYEKYAVDAFTIHATGYLLKPVQKVDLERELTFLYGEDKTTQKRIRVQTFGNFEVWVDGEKLSFGRQKAKELFAYLVGRRGAGVTTREACNILFEDGVYNLSRKSYFQNIVADMRHALRCVGADDVICKTYNNLAIDADKIDCDYYRFLEGDIKAVNQYNGEFMTNYSWAEFIVPILNNEK